MATKRDYYEVLGIKKDATESEIKSAYRKLAMKYHPDKLKDGSSDEKMRELNEAYEVLKDSEKRKMYDAYGHDGVNGQAGFNQGGFQGFSGMDFSDIFGDIFGSFGGFGFGSSKQHNGPQRGQDAKTVLKIKFLDAILGVNLRESFKKWEICEHCQGSCSEDNDVAQCDKCNGSGVEKVVRRTILGQSISAQDCSKCHGLGKIIKNPCKSCKGNGYIQVTRNVQIPIPAGAQTGMSLVLRGFGEKGTKGGEPGDLYVVIDVEEHKYYKRVNDDLYIDLPVSFIDIINEKTILIPTPYGNEELKLKKSYNKQKLLKLPKKGIKTSKRQGDLYVNLNIIIPDLSKKDLSQIIKATEEVNDSSNADFNAEVKKAK
ncbi:molecular chaperone DnaJ [Mycoplasmopsis ciconiae]|uniref:Chaperone protein DnaJ n=1 Tax=Mycoplasmopsis ciconiae TaxID=561067 RepID=A0ABU7MKM2_9BACT|nr:molecular chaperone DnaJ [Mycoplasmopsis ciconiae]